MTHSESQVRYSPVFWPSSILTPRDDLNAAFAAKLVLGLQKGRRCLTEFEMYKATDACHWFIEGLYQSFYAVPSAPLALPLSKSAYGEESRFGIPFSYRLVRRVKLVAEEMGFIKACLGTYVAGGSGFVTRLSPAGRLLKHFEDHGMKWRRMSLPDKSLGIYLNPGRGSTDRRLVSRDEGPSTAAMQDRLQAINSFLATQCISIDLPDSAFTSVMGLKYTCFDEDNDQASPSYISKSGRPAMSMQNVYLHRVFAQGSLSKGGRFYGGWWQQIPSKLRRRILINEEKTVECDFSGLACSILYAQLGIAPPNDAYDIGLNYVPNDPRRSLVKKYMNAVLNDSTRKFRLSLHELKRIGLSHDELHKRLTKLHAPIAHHFNSGVGVDLQFVDSEMAEEVMLRLMNQGEVCLPIHDSFIVRIQAAVLLWKTMEGVFIEKFGQKPGIKPEAGYKGHSIGGPRKEILFDAGLSLFEKFTKHLIEYSIVREFYQSWERTIFSDEESGLRYRAMNQEHAHMKDLGLASIHRHKFWGLPDLLMRP